MSSPLRDARGQIDLRVGGMTCASCAARVEKKLNRLDGVTASVNFATETAHVEYAEPVSVDELIRTVEATGYTAAPPAADEPEAVVTEAPEERSLRQRLIGSAVLTLPVLAVAGVRAGHAGDRVGGVAVPPGRPGQPATRRRDHGHADLARRAGLVRLECLRAVLRRGGGAGDADGLRVARAARLGAGAALPRGGRRAHHVPAGRALLRSPRQAPCRLGVAGAAGAGSQGRGGAP